jgi:hypothetical protein
MTETPVLFVPFARPEYARKAFNAIKKAKPKKLYFYSDKARLDNPKEVENNNIVRALVNEIDWPCELNIYFQEKNVGSIYNSLWAAFDWIFKVEEQAIILEEDCVPSLAFFHFCDQLLEKYKNDQRIWVISGNNFIEDYNPNGYDYFYSYFPYLWGWATWRNRWQMVIRESLPYEKIKEYKLFNQIYCSPKAAKKALQFTKTIVNTPSWDYRFTISMKCNGGLGIIPKVNLVSNIGVYGTHNEGKVSIFHNRNTPDEARFVIYNPPPFVVADFGYSKYWFKKYYLKNKRFIPRLLIRALNWIRK